VTRYRSAAAARAARVASYATTASARRQLLRRARQLERCRALTAAERRQREAVTALVLAVVLAVCGGFILWTALQPGWADFEGRGVLRSAMAACGLGSLACGLTLAVAAVIDAAHR